MADKSVVASREAECQRTNVGLQVFWFSPPPVHEHHDHQGLPSASVFTHVRHARQAGSVLHLLHVKRPQARAWCILPASRYSPDCEPHMNHILFLPSGRSGVRDV